MIFILRFELIDLSEDIDFAEIDLDDGGSLRCLVEFSAGCLP